MVTGVVLPSTTAAAQAKGYPAPVVNEEIKKQTAQPNLQDKYLVANTPDDYLQAISKYQAYSQYNNDPTRGITKVVGNSIPFVDSFARGAMHQGSGSAKIAKTASTGADWGIFTGAVWLYNKAVNKVYDLFPGAAKFREDHPTTAYVGELATSVAVGHGAVRGFEKIGGNEFIDKNVNKFFENKPGISKKIEDITKPLNEFAKNHPKAMGYAGLGVTLTLGGLIAKNIYDVFHAKKAADKRYEQLKDQRYQVTKELLDSAIEEKSV